MSRSPRSSTSDGPASGAPGQGDSLAPCWDVRDPGTYLLLIQLDTPAQLDVGRLGRVSFPAGWYVYVGSALGGLGARLRRHVRLAKRHHWHIDTLRAAGLLTTIAIRTGPGRLECAVASLVAALPGGSRPVPRFGSSDCRCRSHLVHFTTVPSLRLDPDWLVVPCEEPRAAGDGERPDQDDGADAR